MFAYIKGILEVKGDSFVVIDVGGVGFKIFMSVSSIDRLGEIGEVVKVHTHHHVSENNMSLYGFISNDELRMFELLLSVSGIGAKSAITMLSEITPSSFALAVISNDISKLVKIQGIGPKTAQRIVLELKDKLKTEESLSKGNTQIQTAIHDDEQISEAVSALKVLGYGKKEIDKVFEKIDISNLGVEDIIRKSLAILGR